MAAALPPLALYLHLPWCVRKCPYCDFNSHELRGDAPRDAYLDALLDDLASEAPDIAGRAVTSVFIGGGTPSLFSGAQIGRLLQGVRDRLCLAGDAEITLEANPGTVERDAFAAYRDAGVNRVSLGAQSFDDGLLRRIGRIHGAAEIEEAVAELRRAGLENFNIDLMYGLPGQSVEQARVDLERALALGAAHLSHYQLTLEPNTAFAACPPRLPHEDSCSDMHEQGAALLRSAGFEQYEVSAWTRPGRHCEHNLNYWRFGDYLGVGAGAHGKVTLAEGPVVLRRARTRHPKRYLRGPRLAEERRLAPEDLVFEFFLNVLRLAEGFRPEAFEARTALDWSSVEATVERAVADGLLEKGPFGFRPSGLGWRFHNDLQARFLPETA